MVSLTLFKKTPVTTVVVKTPSETSIYVTTASGITVTSSATILGPLFSVNTIFTPPQSCFTNVYDFDGVWRLVPTELQECYPYSEYTTYSPGVCPSGYNAVNGVITTLSIISSQGTTNLTVYDCCPNGFTYVAIANNEDQCQSGLEQPSTITPLDGEPPSTIPATTSLTITEVYELSSDVTLSDNATSTSTAFNTLTRAIISPTWIYAPKFQVELQDTDTAAASTWSSIFASIKSANANLTSANANSSSAYPSATPTATPPHHTTSGGVIAGAVVGALAGLVFVVCFVVFMLRRRKLKTAASENTEWGKQELDGKQVGRVEMDGDKEIKELDAPLAPPVELPGHEMEPPVSEMRNSPNTPVGPDEIRNTGNE